MSLQRVNAKQTKKASFIESLLNVAIGYGVALASQILVFPWFGIHSAFRLMKPRRFRTPMLTYLRPRQKC